MNSTNEDFLSLKNIIKEKEENQRELIKKVRVLKCELDKDILKLQSLCNHEYIRECINSGCYAEYANICCHCNKMK